MSRSSARILRTCHVDNVVADALSRQHDNDSDVGDGVGGEPAITNAITHRLAGVDLDELAADQPQALNGEQKNSLRLQLLQIP